MSVYVYVVKRGCFSPTDTYAPGSTAKAISTDFFSLAGRKHSKSHDDEFLPVYFKFLQKDAARHEKRGALTGLPACVLGLWFALLYYGAIEVVLA